MGEWTVFIKTSFCSNSILAFVVADFKVGKFASLEDHWRCVTVWFCIPRCPFSDWIDMEFRNFDTRCTGELLKYISSTQCFDSSSAYCTWTALHILCFCWTGTWTGRMRSLCKHIDPCSMNCGNFRFSIWFLGFCITFFYSATGLAKIIEQELIMDDL